LMEKIYLKIF